MKKSTKYWNIKARTTFVLTSRMIDDDDGDEDVWKWTKYFCTSGGVVFVCVFWAFKGTLGTALEIMEIMSKNYSNLSTTHLSQCAATTIFQLANEQMPTSSLFSTRLGNMLHERIASGDQCIHAMYEFPCTCLKLITAHNSRAQVWKSGSSKNNNTENMFFVGVKIVRRWEKDEEKWRQERDAHHDDWPHHKEVETKQRKM